MSTHTFITRLETLRAEKAAGQKMLAELEEKRTQLIQTMLRIDGAIQVLEELANESENASVGARDPKNNHSPVMEASA